MNILIITHYYPPEIGAPQARLSEMAQVWVNEGHNVTVLTCFPNHPTGIIPAEYQKIFKSKRYMEEVINGVSVKRCWVYATPNKGFIKKIMGHLSFMFSSVLQGGSNAKKADVIVVSSPTFFSVISAWWLSLRYKKPYVFDVRDLWPAIFVELGILKNKLAIGILEWIEMFLYRKASAVVAVTKKFKENIITRGIKSSKVHVITNGVDLTRFSPKGKNSELLEKYNLTNKFIVLYIGAHGISHALTKIIDSANKLKDIPDIHFLFVGEGAEKEKIKNRALELNCRNITFLSGQPKELMTEFYSISDICLIPLRNIPLFETFIPSKMFEIMGMGKTIVASVKGEAEDILKSAGSAIICKPEDSNEIASAIKTLYNDSDLLRKLGNSGRTFVEKNFDRKILSKQYLKILNNIIHN